jgi:hypothetical protein
MNRVTARTSGTRHSIGTPRASHKHVLFIAGALLAAVVVPTIAQMDASGDLQEKIAAVKQSIAENKQKLQHYQWVETTQLTLKGEAKPAKSSQCMYGPDGTVQKTPIGPPPQPPSGGRMKQRIIEKKTEEMQQYMGQVKSLLAMYVPPDPQKMAQAFQSGNASLNPNPGAQAVALVFKNYAQPGDQMTLTFNTASKKISSVNVNTYMDNPKDVVTLTVQMASLPDGTNYVQQSLLDATAKQLQVTTTNSNYQPVGAH